MMNRVGKSLFGFSSQLIVFCQRKSRIVIRYFPKSESIFLSFLKSDESDLLMVALFLKSDKSKLLTVAL